MSERSFNSTHYSLAQEPPMLIAWAREAAEKLIAATPEGSAPILCYSGMSGVAHATALSVALYNRGHTNFGMVYARKENEKSHGAPVEKCISHVEGNRVLVFVDDLIDTGATRDRAIRRAREACQDYDLGDYYLALCGRRVTLDKEPFA